MTFHSEPLYITLAAHSTKTYKFKNIKTIEYGILTSRLSFICSLVSHSEPLYVITVVHTTYAYTHHISYLNQFKNIKTNKYVILTSRLPFICHTKLLQKRKFFLKYMISAYRKIHFHCPLYCFIEKLRRIHDNNVTGLKSLLFICQSIASVFNILKQAPKGLR